MDKLKNAVIQAAFDAANSLRLTADRMERAAEARDFATLSEISISTSAWPVDAVRGAALAVVRIEG